MRVSRAVIFDMDGTLTDSEPLINEAAVAMFAERGVRVQPADFEPFIGTGENRYIGGVAEKHGVELDIEEAKRRTYEIYLERLPGRLEAFPGAVGLVRAIREQGLAVALASSADRIKVEANLKEIGLPPAYWDAVVTAEDAERKKPAPDIFLKAGERLGIAAADCLVVEDAVNGVQAALAAGMRCFAVAQTHAAGQLQQAHRVFERIDEITLEQIEG